MTKILVGNKSIRAAVQKIMRSNAERKLAIVAFVGAGADRYIIGDADNAKDLQVICWDKAGCTSPETIRTLKGKGVQVGFVHDLHMKLYWGKGRGAVIGSANLSDNGLGDGGLHELAVWVPDSAVDIKTILAGLKEIRWLTPKRLQDLFERTAEFRRRNEGRDIFDKADSRKQKGAGFSFGEWLVSRQPAWKFFVYDKPFKKPPQALLTNPTIKLDRDDYWSGPEWHTKTSEWLLFIDSKRHTVEWGMADHQIPMEKGDPEYAPPVETHYAVQCKTPGYPPFSIDQKFKNAIWKFVKNEKICTYRDCVRYTKGNRGQLTSRQMKLLENLYKKQK